MHCRCLLYQEILDWDNLIPPPDPVLFPCMPREPVWRLKNNYSSLHCDMQRECFLGDSTL